MWLGAADLTWGGTVPLCQSNTVGLDWSQVGKQAGEAQSPGHLPRTCDATVGSNRRLAEMQPLLHGPDVGGDIGQEITSSVHYDFLGAFKEKKHKSVCMEFHRF